MNLELFTQKSRVSVGPFGNAYEADSLDGSVLSDLFCDVCRIGKATRIDLAIDDKGNQYYSVAEIEELKVQEYVKKCLDGHIARATAASYVRNARIFLDRCFREYENELQFNPQKIKKPKSPKRNPYIYGDREIALILEMVKTSVPWITARDRAIIVLMLDSGLRQAEVCGLKLVNIDRERHVMKVTGKGDKDRFVHVGDFALMMLDEYLSMCPYKDSEYAFVDRRGHVLSGNAVRLFVYCLQKKLPFELSSHKLRHNFTTNFCIDSLDRTGSTCVQDLGILMGHESIETTKRYEHFAHELVAVKNSFSHLDKVFKS